MAARTIWSMVHPTGTLRSVTKYTDGLKCLRVTLPVVGDWAWLIGETRSKHVDDPVDTTKAHGFVIVLRRFLMRRHAQCRFDHMYPQALCRGQKPKLIALVGQVLEITFDNGCQVTIFKCMTYTDRYGRNSSSERA